MLALSAKMARSTNDERAVEQQDADEVRDGEDTADLAAYAGVGQTNG
jgi:hypothetical protein